MTGKLNSSENGEEREQIEEKVGYKRPPRAMQFRPGQSGNPRGRPKGARNLSTVVAATIGEHVTVNERGKPKKISKLQAAVKQLVNRAASGDTKSIQLLLALVRASENAPLPVDMSEPGEADLIVLEQLHRRLKKDTS